MSKKEAEITLPGVVYGWNTWASSPPKDYLAKFAATGVDSTHIVLIDDILPPVFKNRDSESQSRQTNLYKVFLKHLGKALCIQDFQIYQISDLVKASDLWEVAGRFTLADVVSSMPARKRDQYTNLNLAEVFHPVSEMLAYKVMARLGANKILRGSGQSGWINVANSHKLENVSFGLIDANEAYEPMLKRIIGQEQLHNLEDMLSTWRSAGLLNGFTDMDEARDFIESIPEPYCHVIDMLHEFFKTQRCTLGVAGGAANETLKPGRSDLDMVVISGTLRIPEFFTSVIPDRVKTEYSNGEIPIVSIKSKVCGVNTSIKYIRPEIAVNYWGIKGDLCYWREFPESTSNGKSYHIYTDTSGDTCIFLFNETSLSEGGSLYIQKRFAGNGNPLIDHNAHMLLTMRIVSDDLCMLGVKLEMIRQLSQYTDISNIPGLLSKNYQLCQKASREIEALVKILSSTKI